MSGSRYVRKYATEYGPRYAAPRRCVDDTLRSARPAADVLTIGRLGHGAGAADYYLQRQAGCRHPAEYYVGDAGEPQGVWCGSSARTIGMSPTLDPAGEAVLRQLLAGCGADGTTLVRPVWRSDPRGRVPVAVLVRAVERVAGERAVEPGTVLGSATLARSYDGAAASVAIDARLPRRPRASLPAETAARIAAAAGLDPVEVFRGPDGRDRLGAAKPFDGRRVDVRRAGLDLTFSAPKSVSVLFGLGDENVVAEVRAAHRVAVEQTLDYLEDLCARAARGHHEPGQPYRRIPTHGWAAVAFEHRSSRAGDPQLHTHVVVPNVVQGVDGRWSAWDTSEAYRQASTGGHLYQAVLRGELTRRLGLSWGPVRRGVAEIDGVPVELRRMFSTRRQAIERHLATRGQVGPRAAQVALFATRPAKRPVSEGDLRRDWRRRARQAGFPAARIVRRVLGTSRGVQATAVDEPAVLAKVLGARGVTARSSTFDRRALLRAVCEAVPAGAPVSVASLRGLATAVVRDTAVVPLVPAVPTDDRRYSTAELLAVEAAALRTAAARAGDRLAVVPDRVVEATTTGAGLSVDQQAAVRRMLTSGAGVEIVVGPAGAGKTAALRVAHAAWSAAGVEVHGVALAAIAARTLQAGTGIPSQSLTRFARAARRSDPERGLPPPGGVLVLDEAGMVGTRDLAWLTETTRRAGVKLVAIGDPAQLPEIDAGGLFAAYARSLPASRLTGNLRQRDPWEQDALTLLRDGDVLAALQAYDDAGRLHLLDDVPAARAAIVEDYLAARRAGRQALMLASSRRDVRGLNSLARHALASCGGLGGHVTVTTAHGGRVEWRVGDEAVVTANHYPLGLVNGSRGRVTRVGADGVTVATETGPLEVPRVQLEAGVLEYGYALTCHRAQGITVDVALLYASGALSRESGYVAMSRGRDANHAYATLDSLVPELDAELDHPAGEPVAAAERAELTRAAVVARLEARGAQTLALAQADESVRAVFDPRPVRTRATRRAIGRNR